MEINYLGWVQTAHFLLYEVARCVTIVSEVVTVNKREKLLEILKKYGIEELDILLISIRMRMSQVVKFLFLVKKIITYLLSFTICIQITKKIIRISVYLSQSFRRRTFVMVSRNVVRRN